MRRFKDQVRQSIGKSHGEGQQCSPRDPLVADDLASREGEIFRKAFAPMRLGRDFPDIAHLARERHPFGKAVIEWLVCFSVLHDGAS